MTGICKEPKGFIEFPDNSGNPVVEEKIEPTIWEKKEENVKEVLDLLVNGNPISQLLLKPELTNKAKEELIKLREQATSDEIDKNLRSIAKLQEQQFELVSEIQLMLYRKEKIKQEIELLEQKRELTPSSIGIISSLR